MGEDFRAWKQHFINQARGSIPHQKYFYKVSEQKGGGDPHLKLHIVSPTQQAVDQAKATLSDPPVVYDPVTGITNQPINESIKKPRKRKQSQSHKKKAKKVKKTIKTKKVKKRKSSKKKVSKKVKSKKRWYDV